MQKYSFFRLSQKISTKKPNRTTINSRESHKIIWLVQNNVIVLYTEGNTGVYVIPIGCLKD